MMSRSVQPKKLAIEHVRQGRERMPIFGMWVRERPDESVVAQAAADLCIFVNIFVVIKIDEAVT